MPKLPAPPRAVPVDRDLTRLAPHFKTKIELLLCKMEDKGRDPMVFEAFRSDERAVYLYGFGRFYDDDRGVVTKAKTAERTWHRYGLAVDIISKTKQWGAPDAFWTDLRLLATELGLRSGDDWDRDGIPVEHDPDEHTADRPHVQWGPPMRVTPSDHAVALLRAGQLQAVWEEVGAA